MNWYENNLTYHIPNSPDQLRLEQTSPVDFWVKYLEYDNQFGSPGYMIIADEHFVELKHAVAAFYARMCGVPYQESGSGFNSKNVS